MKKKSTICVLPAVPSPMTGGGTLMFEILAYLNMATAVHAVVPVFDHLRQDYEQVKQSPVLAGVAWHELSPAPPGALWQRMTVLAGRTPLEVGRFATAHNRALVERIRGTTTFDAELLISCRAVASYVKLKCPPEARVYMMDVEPNIVRYSGPSWKRWLLAELERPKVTRLCRSVLPLAARVGAISPQDVGPLNHLGRRSDVVYVPPLMRPRFVDRSGVTQAHVLITTNFTYPPNVRSLKWFLEECWPYVAKHARLTVTGKDEGRALQSLCSSHVRVHYAGCVSASELDELYAGSAVAVNPTLAGSGFQIKLLDAIARGVPIVSTAFSNRLGPSIPSSDDPQELATLINARLNPAGEKPFNYGDFYAAATAAWDRFLFLSSV
jgi:glycosyltransferase involved in cell wall biosynthesis